MRSDPGLSLFSSPVPSPASAALPALDPTTYARGHRLFEARSDQRSLIVDWLLEQLGARAPSPRLSVLSVGCGDGSVDAALAAADPAPGRTWTGVDPHAPSTRAFVDRLGGLDLPGLDVRSHACTFADLPGGSAYDVITFVHSLYYVADLDATLKDALARLAPGGEVLVLHAPLGALNRLTAAHAPPVEGHAQPWTSAVQAALDRLPVDVRRTELAATVDLTGCADADPALLDFTVQAALDPDRRAELLAALAAIALPGPGLRVPHPVTAYRITPADRAQTDALRRRPGTK